MFGILGCSIIVGETVGQGDVLFSKAVFTLLLRVNVAQNILSWIILMLGADADCFVCEDTTTDDNHTMTLATNAPMADCDAGG